MLTDPDRLLPDAPRVRDLLADAGWSSAALGALLGPGHGEHLDRGEPEPVLRRLGAGVLEDLARLFVLGVPARGATGVPDSWLLPDGTARVRLQAVLHDGVEVLVPHDPAGDDRDTVIGVGAASLTLAAATPRRPVGRTLDVGAGCGVQALLAAGHSGTVTATDASPRASAYARLAGVLNGQDLDVRTGDLLEPAAGERYDLLVSNPPFVIGPQARFTYRDAGLEGDEVCRRLVAGAGSHLLPGGTAVMLASWLHLAGEDGDERVRGWFAGTGCDALVVQRELAEPQDYVTAWLRDGDQSFAQAYGPWMDALHGVDAVAFGVIALRPGPERVTLQAPSQPLAETWGEQVLQHFDALDVLDGDLLAARLVLREDVRLVQTAVVEPDGWGVVSQQLAQQAGLRWSGEVDSYGSALLAGCDGRSPVGTLLSVLAAGAGLTDAEAAEQVLPVLRQLVLQGFLSGR